MQETLDWLDYNQMAEKEEFKGKQKEFEGIVNPMMVKFYQTAGGGAETPTGDMPGAAPHRGGGGELIAMRCS